MKSYSSSTSTDVGDQKIFMYFYYIAGILNILTIFRVLFINPKVVKSLKDKKPLNTSFNIHSNRSSLIGKQFLKVHSTLKHFDIDGKYFWYKFLASLVFGIGLQIIRFLTFAGWDILGSPAYVEVKKPVAVISYAFVLAVHLVFGAAMFFMNKKLHVVVFVILLDIYYAIVPLLNVHGSIFDPSQWYPMRNLNGLEVLSRCCPFDLEMWHSSVRVIANDETYFS